MGLGFGFGFGSNPNLEGEQPRGLVPLATRLPRVTHLRHLLVHLVRVGFRVGVRVRDGDGVRVRVRDRVRVRVSGHLLVHLDA